MASSETMVETTIKLPASSEAQIGDLVNHRMIVTNGVTKPGESDPAVGPTVLEMSCSTENATEDSVDKQKYESRQKEHKEKEEDGAVLKHKNYEELAERSRVQTTEDAEVSSQSTIKFEEHEKVREKDGISTVAEYNAKCDEKHETSVSTVEKVGDREFKRTRSSSKSLTRTCKRIEDMEDTAAVANGGGITETNECNESSETSNFEKGDSEDVLVKRSEKTTKSERSSTTISGKGDPSVFDKYEELLTPANKQKGALIDLGALGEIKLSTKVSSGENTLEKDFQKSDYFNPDLAGLDFSSSSNKEVAKKVEMSNGDVNEGTKSINKDFVRQVKEHAQERTAASSSGRQMFSSAATSLQEQSKSNISSSKKLESSEASKTIREQVTSMAEQNGHAEAHVEEAEDEPRSLPPSLNRRRFYEDDDDENFAPKSLPPPFAPKNRAETDDLIKRILAEAKGGSSSSTSSSAPKMNGTATSASEDLPSPASPTSPTANQKIKVNMGSEKELAETSSTFQMSISGMEGENATKRESAALKSESAAIKSESAAIKSESAAIKSESGAMKSESMKSESMSSESKSESMRNESLKSESKSESMSMQSESMHNSSSKAVGAERKRLSAEEDDEMSLFERRLAKGVEKKLANIFTGDERAPDGEGRHSIESDLSRSSLASERSRGAQATVDQQSSAYSRLEQSSAASTYSKSSEYDDQSKLYSRKSGREETDDFQNKYSRKGEWGEQNDVLNKYSRNEKDEFDELDDEINAWRKNFREQQARKQRAYMEEAEEGASALVQYQGGRGRLVRQGYTEADDDDDDAFALVPRRPPPAEFIPDEDFVPKRRAETNEIVTERTREIRTVVDKQNSVLEKLRRASSSFDELTSEIKNLKQQVIENTARRSVLIDDNFEDEDDLAVAPPPPRAGRFSRYPSGSKSFDFSSYTPGSYSAFRCNRLAELDREYSDNITSGDSLGLARYKKSFAVDDDLSYTSTKASSASTGNRSRFTSRALGRFGRSKSLYDASDDQHSDGDEFEEYKPRARPPSLQDDDQQPYMASVGPGYGSGHGSGDPDLGRSSYRSRFSSADDSATSTSSNRLSYTSRFSSAATSGSSSTGGGYRSRLSRANTLSDFDFDRPSSSQYDRYNSSSSGFTSRFLQKVRDKKKDGGEGDTVASAAAAALTDDTPRRSKPFKSRFLRASFDSSDYVNKSSSYVSRFKGKSDSSSSSIASKLTEPSTPAPSNESAPASDKPEE